MYLTPASAKEKEKFKSFGDLLSFLSGASDHEITRIWAVSAYYDIESIKQLVEHIESRSSKKQKPELFIVIGTIKKGKKEGLKALQEMEFGKFKQGSGIRVTNCGSLFHSKGYLVETAQNGMCAIGSMNLTQNGLKKNEEILTYFRYEHSEDPLPLVESFKEYVKTWRSSNRSKKIGAVSEGEEGILWLPENKARNNAHDKFRQENPEFPDIADESAVQQYFKKLGLHKLYNRKLDNEQKFTLALYKLLFQECRFRRKPYEGVTLRSIGAGWRSGVEHRWNKKKAPKPGKNKQQFAYSAHFDVTSAYLSDQTYHCDVWVYLSRRARGQTSILNVRVENEQKKVDNLQLYVSKPGWENIWNGQYWKIYHDGTMARKKGKGIKHEEVLRAVKNAGYCDWIEDASWWSEGKKVVSLCKLPMAEATWGNSKKILARKFLERLLHYAIIRADIYFRKFSRAK